MKKYFMSVIRTLLLLTALTPIVYSSKFFYPSISLKTFFVRGIILLVAALSLLFFAYLAFKGRDLLSQLFQEFWSRICSTKKAFLIFSGLFVLSQILSAVISENSYRAFWGTIERGEGLFNTLLFVLFFILIIFFWRKRDFVLYFRLSTLVGGVVYFYAFLQIFGITEFPFAFPRLARAESFIGNPAFLAAYSFFVAISAIITIYFEKKLEKTNGFWLRLAYVTLILSPAIILITKTRGALLGITFAFVGSLVFIALQKNDEFRAGAVIRKWARIVFISFALLTLVFFFTRASSFWQNVPGLDRIAKTSLITRDASSQVRVLGWEIGLKAIKERPIFGWGPEQYLLAFQKFYKPEILSYGETWLDKAHNKFIDIGVDQGIIGLLAYFGFLIYFLTLLFYRKKETIINVFIGFIFLGYLIQNFFLFDEINTYAPFFVLCAMVYLKMLGDDTYIEKTGKETAQDSNLPKATISKILGIASVSLSGIFFWLFFTTTLTPASQAYYARQAETPPTTKEFFYFFERATKPYNFIQNSIRTYLLDSHYDGPTVFYKPELRDVAFALLNSVEEVSDREPYGVRYFLREAFVYNQLAKTDAKLYEKGEEAIRKAISIMPNRVELYYTLAISLAGQEHHEEAIEVAEKAVRLNPGVARSYYHLALVSVAGEEKEKARDAMKKMSELDPLFSRWSAWDFQGILLIYEILDDTESLIKIITDSARGLNKGRFEQRFYEGALIYYMLNRDAENFITIAEHMKNNFSEITGDMEILIDLAKNGNWEIIESL